jgi:hypothetical protein
MLAEASCALGMGPKPASREDRANRLLPGIELEPCGPITSDRTSNSASRNPWPPGRILMGEGHGRSPDRQNLIIISGKIRSQIYSPISWIKLWKNGWPVKQKSPRILSFCRMTKI